MKIHEVKLERSAAGSRLSAQIAWEESDRPVQEVYFETGNDFADALGYFPEAFVAAALPPALWEGEKRIAIEGDLCPEFLDNLAVATKVFQHWFPEISRTMTIEASRRRTAQSRPGRAAFFFTGGVDSLASLRANRLQFPEGHPGAVKDGVIVFNLEVADPKAFEYALAALRRVAADSEVTLLPMSTNVRVLKEDWSFWWTAHMGPALGAVAHTITPRISSVLVGSDYDVAHLRPHGSHPLVDPYFSSFDLKIRYDGTALTRIEKLALLADWQVGIDNLRVCNKQEFYQPDRLNCGECEKCVRTMLGLIAVGALHKTSSFPYRDLSAEQAAKQVNIWPTVQPFYEELVQPLATAGRDDLSGVVKRALTIARGEVGLRGRLSKFDRLHLHGGLRALKRALLPNGKS